MHTDTNRTINVTTPTDVRKLEITDHGSAHKHVINTNTAASNAAIRATIYDPDGTDGLNVTAYICDTGDYASCSDATYTYAKNLAYLEPTGQDEYYYTYNGTDNMPQFWKKSGTWKLHVTVIDGISTDDNETNFSYSTLMAVNISANITLGGGTPILGQWNSGTDRYTITNRGNLNLSITWNASDMESGEDSWILNRTDFAIDDDNDHTSDTDNLAWVFLNGTTKYFNYSTGLERCIAWACDDASTNKTLNTYYHIAPPIGLAAGAYNTSITLTLASK